MGVLGEYSGDARAAGLRAQGAAYEKLTSKHVTLAYELVAVVAQPAPGTDGKYRRRESSQIIRSMLDEAHANGFKLVLDVQPGRSSAGDEMAALRPFLIDPDVYLALDPEFSMSASEVPGQQIGEMAAADVSRAVDILEEIIGTAHLPPKVLIVHQFRWDMLPDKAHIKTSALVDIVLDMDGFGSQPLKLSSYRDVMQQGRLAFAGIKLFYRQDQHLFTPEQVLALTPSPSVVIYQ